MISIILATCFRPALLYDMLASLKATTQGYDVELISVIDQDWDSVEVVNKFGFPGIIDFDRFTKRGALACWNLGLYLSRGEIIVPAGDDQIFHADWIKYALESHRERLDGYGVIGMNDLAYGENQVATMFLFDRKYCKEVMGGVLCPPVYAYLCVDLEWNEKAKLTGHFYRDMRAKVEHLHSAHNKRPFDVHDEWKNSNPAVQNDMKIYQERKSRGFPVEWSPLI